jgi:hypothetical protein
MGHGKVLRDVRSDLEQHLLTVAALPDLAAQKSCKQVIAALRLGLLVTLMDK